MQDWPFDQAPNVAAVTCRTVVEGGPVLFVIHYSDDHSWAFLDEGPWDPDDARVVAMDEMLRIDPSLAGIADLPPGWVAKRRTSEAPWATASDPEV